MINKILNYIKTIIPEENIQETGKAFILPTLCHNKNIEDASRKLYLYKNEETGTPLFHCFTECGETFNIYQFIQKYYRLRDKEISYREAFKLINGEEFKVEKKEKNLILQTPQFFKNPTSIQLPTYSESTLEIFNFNNIESHPWFLEGIDSNIIKKFEIYYSKSFEGVIIPHRDYLNRLVGIRIRTCNETKINSAKYMPLEISKQLYSHPLSMNFFGISQNEESIRDSKTVYLFEGEKSVLKSAHMFKHSLSLAVCGSTISAWQMQMLIHYLGVENVFICFDKEYQTHKQMFDYITKIRKMVHPLLNFMNVYVAIDDKNLLGFKDSPVDRTKKEFENLHFKKI